MQASCEYMCGERVIAHTQFPPIVISLLYAVMDQLSLTITFAT
jgi:hypothetical protein